MKKEILFKIVKYAFLIFLLKKTILAIWLFVVFIQGKLSSEFQVADFLFHAVTNLTPKKILLSLILAPVIENLLFLALFILIVSWSRDKHDASIFPAVNKWLFCILGGIIWGVYHDTNVLGFIFLGTLVSGFMQCLFITKAVALGFRVSNAYLGSVFIHSLLNMLLITSQIMGSLFGFS